MSTTQAETTTPNTRTGKGALIIYGCPGNPIRPIGHRTHKLYGPQTEPDSVADVNLFANGEAEVVCLCGARYDTTYTDNGGKNTDGIVVRDVGRVRFSDLRALTLRAG